MEEGGELLYCQDARVHRFPSGKNLFSRKPLSGSTPNFVESSCTGLLNLQSTICFSKL